ncbi:MAG: FAD-dependent oxidoreductase [Sedimentibacter sp.]
MKSLKLKDNIYWVGSLDPDLDVFDIIMRTEFGTSYNSYVVKGSEKTALIETVKLKFYDDYMEKLKEVNVDVSEVDYIVLNHTEPDHSGSIENIIKLSPNIQLVGSKQAIEYMKHICNTEFKSIVVKNGDELSLGDKTFKFYDAKFLHWPDTIFTYLPEDKILFTCDAFGAHYSLDSVLESTVENKDDHMGAFKYYFDNILGPFKKFFLQAIEKIEGLDIDMVCTGHGPVLDEDPWKIINLSKELSAAKKPFEDKLVVIPYVSAYGYTKELAQAIKNGVEEAGIKVELYDMVYDDRDKVLERIYWADGIIFGSPTIVGDALEPIWEILYRLNPIIHKGKTVSAFGSYGWSGEAVPNIMQRLKQLRFKTVGEGLRVRFKPNEDQLKTAYEFGVEFGNVVEPEKKKPLKKWKCLICGAVVEGEVPPARCPVCGVGPEMFEELKEEKVEIKEEKKTYKWKCTVCGEIVEGTEPPERCPVCGVSSNYFVKVEEIEEAPVSDEKENIVIIGASGAGMGAAVEIRKRNNASDITILSKESVKGYFRPQLTKMLSRNDVTIEQIAIKTDDWFKENNVKLLLNKVVERIDAKNSKVILKDKEEIPYTKLIIASGAEVFVPPLEGRDKKGVFTLRYAKDGLEIKDYAKGKKTAAIIGGGILGLEAASELNNMGLEVTVLERGDRILPRQLDHDASKVLEQIVDNVGVNFLKGVETKEIVGDEAVMGVLLDNGETVDADVVIISTGVKANTEIAGDNGIEIKRAIVVNEKMETAVPNIYACGDCAEFEGINYALWSEAIEQGKTAGINAARGDYKYSTIIPSTTLNAFGTSVFSIGDIGSDPEAEYKTYEGNDSKSYIKLYFKNNILAGGILIGDTSKTVELIAGFEKSKTMEEMIEKFKA